MTARNGFSGTGIGGASNSVPQICHRKHHLWLTKRLAYVGMGNYKEVSFFVWTHSTSREQAENDTICRRIRDGFVPVGTFVECMLDPIRMVNRRPERKMSDIWYPSLKGE